MCLETDKQFNLLGVRRAEMHMHKTQDEMENIGWILNKQATWSDHDQMKDIVIKPIRQTGIVSWRDRKSGKVSSWWTPKWLKGMEDRTVTEEYCRLWLDSTVGELIIYWLWGTIKWEVGENTKVLNLVTWRTQLLTDIKMLKGVGGFNGKMISLWTCWISDAWGRPSEVI